VRVKASAPAGSKRIMGRRDQARGTYMTPDINGRIPMGLSPPPTDIAREHLLSYALRRPKDPASTATPLRRGGGAPDGSWES